MARDTLKMKAHIGVDAYSGAMHTVEAAAAKVSGVDTAHKLIRKRWTIPGMSAIL